MIAEGPSRTPVPGVRRRLGTIAVAYLAVIVIGGVVSMLVITAWTDAIDRTRAGLRAQTVVERLATAYSDQEAGVRGFLITGLDSFLEPYRSGQVAAGTERDEVRSSISDREVLTALDDVTRRGEVWRTEVAEPSIAQRRTSGLQAAALVRGQSETEDLRGSLDDLTGRLDRFVGRTEDRALTLRAATFATLILTLLAAIVVTLVASGLIRRWLVTPLTHLQEAVNRIGGRTDTDDGTRSATIPREGPEELQEVAEAIDSLQQELTAQANDATRARQTLEQSTLLAVRLRAELSHELGEYPPGWSVAADLLPAEGVVAGDCYDISLSSPDQIAVVVLDIAGHGAGPGIMALRCKELLKAALRSGLEPGPALDWLFDQDHGLTRGDFFTAFAAVVDTPTGRCNYANAGHPPAFITTDAGLTELDPTGPLFGPLPASTWSTAKAVIEPGHQLVVYTDGLIEARDATRGFYGPERLALRIGELGCQNAEDTITSVLGDLRTFSDVDLRDDVTILAICRD